MKYSFLYLIFIISIILRLILINIHLTDAHYVIQQDHYADYAQALKQGVVNTPQFSLEDRRLLPAYPILIMIVSYFTNSYILAGLLISLVAYGISVWLLFKLTNNPFLTCLCMFFPPIWIYETTKIATEPLVVALLLYSVYVYFQQKHLLAGLFLGFAFDVRLIALCLLLAILLQKTSLEHKKNIFLGFIISASLLFIYNIWQFGLRNIFIQFMLYPQVGRGSIGFIQIIKDVFRTIDWRQYRILISGLFYLLFNITGASLLYKQIEESQLTRITFFWSLFSLLFIGVFGPTPLLEEFSRFTVPFLPATLLGYSTIIKIKTKYII